MITTNIFSKLLTKQTFLIENAKLRGNPHTNMVLDFVEGFYSATNKNIFVTDYLANHIIFDPTSMETFVFQKDSEDPNDIAQLNDFKKKKALFKKNVRSDEFIGFYKFNALYINLQRNLLETKDVFIVLSNNFASPLEDIQGNQVLSKFIKKQTMLSLKNNLLVPMFNHFKKAKRVSNKVLDGSDRQTSVGGSNSKFGRTLTDYTTLQNENITAETVNKMSHEEIRSLLKDRIQPIDTTTFDSETTDDLGSGRITITNFNDPRDSSIANKVLKLPPSTITPKDEIPRPWTSLFKLCLDNIDKVKKSISTNPDDVMNLDSFATDKKTEKLFVDKSVSVCNAYESLFKNILKHKVSDTIKDSGKLLYNLTKDFPEFSSAGALMTGDIQFEIKNNEQALFTVLDISGKDELGGSKSNPSYISYPDAPNYPLVDFMVWINNKPVKVSVKSGADGKGAFASFFGLGTYIYEEFSVSSRTFTKLTSFGEKVKQAYPNELQLFQDMFEKTDRQFSVYNFICKYIKNYISDRYVAEFNKLSKQVKNAPNEKEMKKYIQIALNTCFDWKGFVELVLQAASFDFMQINATPKITDVKTGDYSLVHTLKYPAEFKGNVKLLIGTGRTLQFRIG